MAPLQSPEGEMDNQMPWDYYYCWKEVWLVHSDGGSQSAL